MTSALQNAIVEETAKSTGYKELIEDDIEDPEDDSNVIEHVKKNLDEMKIQFLNLKVVQAKYKANIVNSSWYIFRNWFQCSKLSLWIYWHVDWIKEEWI